MRSMKEVEQEYGNLVARSGQLQYQIVVLGQDLALLNEQIKELNFEAAKINAAAKEEAAKALAIEEVKS